MLKLTRDIKSLYAINLIEGEGVGTAYEYYAKFRKLQRFIDSIERPRTILIAGLPEKYGLSMDFFLLAQMLDAETIVVDERPDTLERTRRVLSTLVSRKLLRQINVAFMEVSDIAEFNTQCSTNGKFDLALSSEVLQRLDAGRIAYVSSLKRTSNYFSLFAPNAANESHASLSGLNTVSLEELLKYCQAGHPAVTVYDSGYVDMPPFPPGLSRSQEKRELASANQFEALLMKGLEMYGLCEAIIPNFLKRKIAHITYVMVKTQ